MNCWLNKLILAFLFVFYCVPQVNATIVGTPHDLSSGNIGFLYRSNEPQVCVFCHTPHGGNLTGPLWNRDVPQADAFLFYSSSTLTSEAAGVSAIGDESLLCLSCHDGSIAVNSLLNYGSVGAMPFIPPAPGPVEIVGTGGANRRIGALTATDPTGSGHLEDDHPISFNYAAAATEEGPLGLKPIGSVDAAIKFFGTDNRLECSSCHDVHNNSLGSFLIKDNTGSALCLSCHVK